MSTADSFAIAATPRDPDHPWGEIAGVPVGTRFASRREAFDRGVHRETQAGIAGTRKRGAESIVVSGGYADRDEGDVLYYTGHGGLEGRRHVRDQTFEDRGNAALVTSKINGTPVRVIRGRKAEHGPASGYRYDGLFLVKDSWYERESHGYKVCRFLMVKAGTVDVGLPGGEYELSAEPAHPKVPVGTLEPTRRPTSGEAIVRSIEVARFVKEAHDYTCQMCGTRLAIAGRGYAQGAHIQAVGGAHKGPDIPENMLCLCPNCHALFDLGAILVNDDLSVTCNGKATGVLRVAEEHYVDTKYLALHRAAHS
ncbi:YDG/SRA domain-containing protein [Amycolatopsis sp. NPDC051106]|uniref:YDG/SRA domain-containing protein n=1 Tax=unclassified Amycolatopsis TaxID=2618356 RepID=UPI003441C5C6